MSHHTCVIDFIEEYFKQSRPEFQKNQARVVIIAKTQSIIINEIPLKMMSRKQIVDFNKRFSEDDKDLKLKRSLSDENLKKLMSIKK